MGTDEVKNKSKRKRHCIKNDEIYHLFIHDNDYYYKDSSSYKSSCRCFYNTFIAEYNSNCKSSFNLTEEMFYSRTNILNSHTIVAVINREKKIILINKSFGIHSRKLIAYVPDNYTVLVTEDRIKDANLLSTKEGIDKAIESYIKHTLINFVNRHRHLYAALNDKIRNVYYEIDDYIIDDRLTIINELSKFKVKSKPIYNKRFDVAIPIYKGWSIKEYITIKSPSLRNIIEDTIFSEKDKLKITKMCFYTKYCYGYNISMKTVDKYWDTDITLDKLCDFIYKRFNVQITDKSKYVSKYKWQTGIKALHDEIRKDIDIKRRNALEQSEKNYINAINKLYNSINIKDVINDWRENRASSLPSISYNNFIPNYRSINYGYWKISTVRVRQYNIIKYTQLRLKNNEVETSKYATVKLTDAINLWNLVDEVTNHLEYREDTVMHEFKNVKVGHYPLRGICNRLKDGIWTWCIIIGCHTIFIDDFLDFIKYYDLYEKFGITKTV